MDALKETSRDVVIVRKISLSDIMIDSEHSEFKTYFLSFEEIVKSKIETRHDRLVYDEHLGLFLDDESGVMIEKNFIKYYTFRIDRGGSKFENIVFVSKPDGNCKTVIVSYDISYDEIKYLGLDEIKNREAKYSTYDIESESTGLPNLLCIQTWEFAMVPVDQGELMGNNGWEGIWILTGLDCSWVGGGGSGTGDGNSGGDNGNHPGGGGGSGSDSGDGPSGPQDMTDVNGVVTTPVYNIKRNHIEELNRIYRPGFRRNEWNQE